MAEREGTMKLQLGDIAPDFLQESTDGPIQFYEWAGNDWVLLFSHPRDFTPVCTTELGEVAKIKPEFDRRGIKIIGLSVDGVEDHHNWIRDIEETQGVAVNFPLLADSDRSVSTMYGMIHPNADDTETVRSVFVIDDEKKVRLIVTYPASTGRDFGEILRAIDSLQLTDNYQVATPVDWHHGDDVIIMPSVSNQEAKELFPGGWDEKKSYLRMVAQPNL
jgi:alkyl hydroperoxide reductase subunit AhpC